MGYKRNANFYSFELEFKRTYVNRDRGRQILRASDFRIMMQNLNHATRRIIYVRVSSNFQRLFRVAKRWTHIRELMKDLWCFEEQRRDT